MKLVVAGTLAALLSLGQSAERPRFLAADVRVSPKRQNQGTRATTSSAERNEIKNATMVDLISLAYNSTPNKVVGGPSWLEMERFDLTVKQASQTAPDTQKQMLQSLLAERFQLVVREETRPLPTYALTASAKPKMKEGDGSGEVGCKPQTSNAPAGEGTIRATLANEGGAPIQLTLSNGVIEYQCRNLTMAAFVTALRGLLGANLGTDPVLEQTGLTGT